MANSRVPGFLSCHNTRVVPSRTPGPLGFNDHADPNKTSLLGDTPGPLGFNDHADWSLRSTLACHIRRKTASRPPLAVGLHEMAGKKIANTGSITLNEAQEISLKTSSFFEGGKPMNYEALADDFDGMGTSFGIIQWNFGQDTLGPLLKKMMNTNQSAFACCFGPKSDFETLKTAIEKGDNNAQLKWARSLLKSHRREWESVFHKIGSTEAFNKIQLEEAVKQYHPLVIKVIKHLRNINNILLLKIEFRSYAAIFDMCVQQHGVGKALTQINNKLHSANPSTQLELMKIVVVERAQKASKEWQSDCISRRMGILTGQSFTSTEHGVKKQRTNPNFELIRKYGEHNVSGL